MTYRSIAVSMDIDAANESIAGLAADLAGRSGARLIGVAAASVPPPVVSVDGMVFDAGLMQQERRNIETRLEILRRQFEQAGAGIEDREWRGEVDGPTRFLLESSRAADLIVLDAIEGGHAANGHRSVDAGSLALNAGRPVLFVQSGAERLTAHRILIAWKDTREARRAVVDALPFLAQATEVVVATVDADGDSAAAASLRDVDGFLSRHGVKARTELVREASAHKAIAGLALSMNADLVVSGAYGHSRIRELIFGGVTRTLLGATSINRLMSS
jgi:nucleotide-binding universal stress UspA family protein